MTTAELTPFVNHVADDDLPWVDGGNGIQLKLLRYSRDTGVWVVRNRFAPGVRVQTHRHTGAVHGFTLSGRWCYAEYDWQSTAGSFIFEPPGSVHTLTVPAASTEPADAVFVIEGANLDLTPDGRVERVIDGASTLVAYERLCEMQGLPRPTGVLT